MELEQAFQGAYVFSGNVARWGFLPLAESSQTLEWLTADGRKSPQLQAHAVIGVGCLTLSYSISAASRTHISAG